MLTEGQWLVEITDPTDCQAVLQFLRSQCCVGGSPALQRTGPLATALGGFPPVPTYLLCCPVSATGLACPSLRLPGLLKNPVTAPLLMPPCVTDQPPKFLWRTPGHDPSRSAVQARCQGDMLWAHPWTRFFEHLLGSFSPPSVPSRQKELPSGDCLASTRGWAGRPALRTPCGRLSGPVGEDSAPLLTCPLSM